MIRHLRKKHDDKKGTNLEKF